MLILGLAEFLCEGLSHSHIVRLRDGLRPFPHLVSRFSVGLLSGSSLGCSPGHDERRRQSPVGQTASGSVEKSFASTAFKSVSSLKLAENFATESIPRGTV